MNLTYETLRRGFPIAAAANREHNGNETVATVYLAAACALLISDEQNDRETGRAMVVGWLSAAN